MVVALAGTAGSPGSLARATLSSDLGAMARPTRRILLSGAVGGAATAVGFVALHHLLISDIWFSLVPMTLAGAVCGACLAWSYRLVLAPPAPASWVLYNLHFVLLFMLLGGVSFLLYEPAYTVAGLSAGIESPDALLRQVIPLSAAFGLVAGIVVSVAWARSARKATSLIITYVVLTVLLGHNAGILGMVHLDRGAVPLLAEFFGLIAIILAGNATAFLLLERRGLFHAQSRAAAADSPPLEAL
jgi:hypothetical protein